MVFKTLQGDCIRDRGGHIMESCAVSISELVVGGNYSSQGLIEVSGLHISSGFPTSGFHF